MFSTIFEEYSNIKFSENSSSRSRVVPCVQTDGQTNREQLPVPFRGSENAPKYWQSWKTSKLSFCSKVITYDINLSYFIALRPRKEHVSLTRVDRLDLSNPKLSHSTNCCLFQLMHLYTLKHQLTLTFKTLKKLTCLSSVLCVLLVFLSGWDLAIARSHPDKNTSNTHNTDDKHIQPHTA